MLVRSMARSELFFIGPLLRRLKALVCLIRLLKFTLALRRMLRVCLVVLLLRVLFSLKRMALVVWLLMLQMLLLVDR